MNILQAIILGLVQGLTEFIPVSSSGHLEIFRILFNWPTEQMAFDVMVHVGTLTAVIVYFRKEVLYLINTTVKIIKRIFNNPSLLNNLNNFNEDRLPVLLALGMIPTGIAGLLIGNQLSDASSSSYVIGGSLIIVGLLMWFVDSRAEVKKKIANIDYYDALMIGASQALALIKGVSRSGITITTGRFLGYSISDAAKYTFLLSIPSIGVAGLYELIKLIGNPAAVDWTLIIIGFVTSFVTGYLSIKLFLNLLNKIGIKPFVFYRIAIGIIVIAIAIIK